MRKKEIKAGLVGSPLDRSLSPALFSVFAELVDIAIEYRKLDCAPDMLDAALIEARGAGFAGLNVTLPYKEAMLRKLDLCDPAAAAAGAVNAVRFGKAGLEGLNTDARALIHAMEEIGFSAAGKTAVVFGSGGSAASSGWALGRCGAASVTFLSRNAGAAARLSARLSACFPATAYAAAPFTAPEKGPDIFVNATPLGMYAEGSPPCAPGPRTLCVDLPYAPGGAAFARAGATAGAAVIDGLSLLAWQGALSLRFWCGLPAGDIKKFKQEAMPRFLQRIGKEGVC